MSFFLFPGQGSQKTAMGQDFYERSAVAKAVLDEANELFGEEDLLQVLFAGAQEDLNQTRIAQPGLLAVEVAIAQHLIAEGHAPSGCAGHSLGEIPALVVSGGVSFDEAFRFTMVRAQLMSEDIPEGGMAAVMGIDAETIEANLPKEVQVANFNGPGQTIISGTKAGLEAAKVALTEAGAKRVLPLPVSGPFHSDLMGPASEKFAEALAHVPFKTPMVPFISSVSATRVTDPESIRLLLAEQLYSPVRWTEVLTEIGTQSAIEVGPGNVLRGIAKRMDGAPKVEPAAMVSDIEKLSAGEA